MKAILASILLLFSSHLKSQFLADTLVDNSISYSTFDLSTANELNSFYALSRNSSLTKDIILIYDQQLQITDTVQTNTYWENSVFPSLFYEFNNKQYLLASHPGGTIRTTYVHRLEGNILTDSFKLAFDTLANVSISKGQEINENTFRVILDIWDTLGVFIIDGIVVDVDSNFQFINQYPIDQSIFSSTGSQIQSITVLSDSLWHVHTVETLFGYNPLTKSTLFFERLEGRVYTSYVLNDSTYLGIGISTVLSRPPARSTSNRSLGFYVISKQGEAIDTISFNNYKMPDPTSTNWIEYSSEKAYKNNSIIYDSSSIYLASSSSYFPNNSASHEDDFFIVKTDIFGHELWRFSIGGPAKITTLSDIIKTPDDGCIISGNYTPDKNNIHHRAAILIKLGPDGTISNVELDAPETVVNFYPNPVKDKLHYSFLPDGKGSYTIEIVDMQGKPVLEKILDYEKGFIPVQLHSGFYLYNLKDNEGKVQQVGKLLVED